MDRQALINNIMLYSGELERERKNQKLIREQIRDLEKRDRKSDARINDILVTLDDLMSKLRDSDDKEDEDNANSGQY